MGKKLPLNTADLQKLARLSTPTVYNGWEQITKQDRLGGFVNNETLTDFMPQMGSMVGYAVTGIFEPGNPSHLDERPNAWREYREYLGRSPGPKIVITQDLDKPNFTGAVWGEVNASICRSLSCVGAIVDGCVRDVDEVNAVGFKFLAARLCVGHAYGYPVRWDCETEVFGTTVNPGDLIHADKHGFLVIPPEDQEKVLEASLFMDRAECDTMISVAGNSAGKPVRQVLDEIHQSSDDFNRKTKQKFDSTMT
ncbi:MAG: RraA family protein [Opitutales bacterium]|jgi:4-hydroxy-4-methyl-2-oxoglutarate aldolase